MRLTKVAATLTASMLVISVLAVSIWIRPCLKRVDAFIAASQGPLPPRVLAAIVAAEDPDFFSHTRVHTIESLFAEVESAVLVRAPDPLVEHASLTDQVVRFHLYDRIPRRALIRIPQELLVDAILDARGRNLEIATTYANTVYLGHLRRESLYGITTAAHAYFGRAPEQLSVAQLVSLAAAIRRPSEFSPMVASESAVTRRSVVLQRLLTQHVISSAEAEAAAAEWATQSLQVVGTGSH